MEDKNKKYNTETNTYVDEQDGRYGDKPTDATPGINTPGIELPAFNPPVPNRAWTAMRAGKAPEDLTDEEMHDPNLYNNVEF